MKRLFYITILLLLVLVLFIYVYKFVTKQDSIQNKIQDYITTECTTVKPCTITVSDFTDFKWDTLYYAENGPLLEAKKDEIGIAVPEYKKLYAHKIIFTLNNNVVHFEEIESGIEDFLKDEIIFEVADDTSGVYTYTPETAVFKVHYKKNMQKQIYYNLE